MDKSQSAVADASVALKSKQTGLSRTASTNESGSYRFELLPVGTYIVTITKTGFTTVEETVETSVGQTATANAELSPGSMSETIEVTSEAPIVDQAKTDVSLNITPTEVQELPLFGRDVANLAYLAPGVKAADSLRSYKESLRGAFREWTERTQRERDDDSPQRFGRPGYADASRGGTGNCHQHAAFFSRQWKVRRHGH